MISPGCNFKPAYPTVVASGPRRGILHYTRSDHHFDPENTGILVDFGIDFYGYKSDITRCYGFKTDAELELYSALYRVQGKLIEAIKIGFEKKTSQKERLSLNQIFSLQQMLLMKELVELGFTMNGKEMIEVIQKICPHHCSHYIGLDVHDCATVDKNMFINNGMCFTVEPGVYG